MGLEMASSDLKGLPFLDGGSIWRLDDLDASFYRSSLGMAGAVITQAEVSAGAGGSSENGSLNSNMQVYLIILLSQKCYRTKLSSNVIKKLQLLQVNSTTATAAEIERRLSQFSNEEVSKVAALTALEISRRGE